VRSYLAVVTAFAGCALMVACSDNPNNFTQRSNRGSSGSSTDDDSESGTKKTKKTTSSSSSGSTSNDNSPTPTPTAAPNPSSSTPSPTPSPAPTTAPIPPAPAGSCGNPTCQGLFGVYGCFATGGNGLVKLACDNEQGGCVCIVNGQVTQEIEAEITSADDARALFTGQCACQ
jgi:hypothetical protein